LIEVNLNINFHLKLFTFLSFFLITQGFAQFQIPQGKPDFLLEKFRFEENNNGVEDYILSASQARIFNKEKIYVLDSAIGEILKDKSHYFINGEKAIYNQGKHEVFFPGKCQVNNKKSLFLLASTLTIQLNNKILQSQDKVTMKGREQGKIFDIKANAFNFNLEKKEFELLKGVNAKIHNKKEAFKINIQSRKAHVIEKKLITITFDKKVNIKSHLFSSQADKVIAIYQKGKKHINKITFFAHPKKTLKLKYQNNSISARQATLVFKDSKTISEFIASDNVTLNTVDKNKNPITLNSTQLSLNKNIITAKGPNTQIKFNNYTAISPHVEFDKLTQDIRFIGPSTINDNQGQTLSGDQMRYDGKTQLIHIKKTKGRIKKQIILEQTN